MRYFTYTDEKSDKFWEIELNDTTHTIRYGKAGAKGRSQTKTFDTPDKAQKDYEKQIINKVTKGYVEVDPGNSSQRNPAPSAVRGLRAKPALGLYPHDYDWVTYGHAEKQTELPEPKPFDLKNCMARFTKMKGHKTDSYGWNRYYEWETLNIPDAMTDEEARFWISAMILESENGAMRTIKKELEKQTFDKPFSIDTVLKDHGCYHSYTPFIAKPFLALFGKKAYLSTLLDFIGDKEVHRKAWSFFRGFMLIKHRFSDEEIQQLKDALEPIITPRNYANYDNRFALAAVLGMHDALLGVVKSIPDDQFKDFGYGTNYGCQEIILGLGSKRLVIEQMRRFNLYLSSPHQIRAWIAHTGFSALDVIEKSISVESNLNMAECLFKTIEPITDSKMAPVMLGLFANSRASRLAKAWLETHPEKTIEGIIHALSDEAFPLKKNAMDLLRKFKRQGFTDLIKEIAEKSSETLKSDLKYEVVDYKDPLENAFTDDNTPDWLNKGLVIKGNPKDLTWISAEDLPPITIDGMALNKGQITALLNRLKSARKNEPTRLTSLLKNAGDGECVEAFGWALFEAWLKVDAPAKEKWAMLALGLLGADESALKITPLIRKWPGESQHARAVTGLEVLRRIGTKTALMQLSGISQKVKFRGIKTKAQSFMEMIAKDKGMTKAELEDMVVPDCGLNKKGERVFDYGPRQFHFILGADLKPKLKDENGKLRDNPPKPAKKDDAALAPSAQKEWKIMKKQIREIANIQATRLEQAMVVGRRWTPSDFTTLIARHPMMTHLARLLLWGGYDEKGALKALFRLTDEQDFADALDDTMEISGFEKVGIVHPFELDDAQKEAWGQIFSDYEILPPFLQLSRPVATLDENDQEKTSIPQFENLSFAAPTLIFGLEKMGWTRGVAEDAGCFDEHSKQFPAAGFTAVISYEGTVGMGYIDPDEEVTILKVRFVKGMRPPGSYDYELKAAIDLKEVNPIVLSEVITDMNVLAAKVR